MTVLQSFTRKPGHEQHAQPNQQPVAQQAIDILHILRGRCATTAPGALGLFIRIVFSPVFIIHGTDDKVVPLASNSAKLEEIYEASGAGDLIEVMKVEGQGHSFWPGFFNCQELVDFVIKKAIPESGK